MRTQYVVLCAVALGGAMVSACSGPSFDGGLPGDGSPDPTPDGDPMVGEPSDPSTDGEDTGPTDADGDGYIDVIDPSGTLAPEWQDRLREREIDYGAALHTASLRLRGTLPTLTEIRYVQHASDPATAYGQLIDRMLSDPLFTQRAIDFFRDAFRMGGGALDSAPVFAAQLLVEDRDFTELLTADSNTCPTYDRDADTFAPAACDNGIAEGQHAGVLTNPAVMRQFYSNLAFRRTRWVQEVFACSPFPAEIGSPIDVGGEAPYTAPWAWDSISGTDNGGRVDFHDTSSVICANCHATMNHVAPLFARFDEDGMWNDEIQVRLPIEETPVAVLTDWLPPGQTTAWRFMEPAPSLQALGTVMAADEDVERCTVTRVWNWAMGHGDVISNVDLVPAEVVEPYVATYRSSDHRLRAVVRAIFTADDFVRF